MEGTIDNTFLAFIPYRGTNQPNDSSHRALIRRRAMRNVAETKKKKATESKCKLRLYLLAIPFMSNPVISQKDTKPSNWPQNRKSRSRILKTEYHQMIEQQRLPIKPPFSSPYSNLLVTEYFSILDLAPFTGLRLGATTLSFFTKDPSNIIQALSSSVPGSQKFLSFIFPRYGQALTLSLAVDCIVAKVQQMIMNSGSNFAQNIVVRQHTRVLKCIQQDLNDRSQWMSSETLCAIQLLGLFDVRIMLQLRLLCVIANFFVVDQQCQPSIMVMPRRGCLKAD
jgi:hypothetical protein